MSRTMEIAERQSKAIGNKESPTAATLRWVTAKTFMARVHVLNECIIRGYD
ncbi:hypothetical protein DPMN_107965 [Dreissena polymorpha]|uniref:Uncharacterized protein n=1 Tax=Dreissena polymorpha TaxID=45954 RepID=A0A9D4K7W0_DREPO|nr:hypothetical protein DPMN_107965 [Dreissena polymorpha]